MANLKEMLEEIGTEYGDKIDPKSEIYSVVDISKALEVYGLEKDERFDDEVIVIPLDEKKFEGGLGFQVNGNDLAGYCQLESGLAVPRLLAKESGLSFKEYKPHKRMILY